MGTTKDSRAATSEPTSADVLDPEPIGLVEIALDVEQHTALPPSMKGSDALRAVMCSVSHRLDGVRTEELISLLPPDLKPLMQTCSAHPVRAGTSNVSITEQVAEHLGTDAPTAEKTTAVVLEAVLQRIPREAAEHLADMLPEEVRHPRSFASDAPSSNNR